VVGIYVLSLARATALVGAWFMYSAGTVSCADAEKAPTTMLLLVEKDNDRTVDIRQGESVRISLPENATSGYRWAIDRYDEEFIDAIATEPHYPSNAIGSGGEVAFIFQGKKIGTGEIVLKHWRHWEGESSVTNRFRLRLHVQP
jgi:inhibitor of cysteine peptidase